MAITWTAELAAPTGLVLTPIVGGSIPQTTYYIRVCATTKEYFMKEGNDRQSPPCAEGIVTLSGANQSLKIEWNNVTDATHYNVYITTLSSGTNRWNQKRLNKISDGNTTNATIIKTAGATTAITLTSNARFGGYNMDWFAYDSANAIPGNIALEQGNGYVLISGAVGNITLADIEAVVPASHKYYDGTRLVIKGGIYCNSTATGELALVGKVLGLTQRHYVHVSSTFVTDCNQAILQNYTWGSWELRNYELKNCYLIANYLGLGVGSSGVIVGGNNSFIFKASTVDEGGNKIFGGGAYIESTQNISRLRVDSEGTAATIQCDGASGYDIKLLDCELGGEGYFWPHIQYYETADNIEVRRLRVERSATYQIRVYYEWNDPFPLFDPEFPNWANNNHPGIFWSYSAGYGNQINICRSVNLKILDEAENEISGATVKLKDKNGTEIFSVSTDVNGEIVEQDVVVTEITKKSGGGTYDSDYNDLSPFTLTIQKSGYKKYVSKFTLSEKFNQVITLEKRRFIN